MLIYYIFSLFFFEFFLRIFTIGNIHFEDILLTSIFTLTIAILFYLITSVFSTGSFLISIILVGITTIVFLSHLIYYKIFNMFYTIYSASNITKVFEFWPEAINAIIQNPINISLLLLPLVILILGKKKFFPIKAIQAKYKLSLIMFIIAFHMLGIGIISRVGKGPNTAHDIYYKTNFPLLSIEKFGLLTTIRIDAYRNITRWTPSLSANASSHKDEYEEENLSDSNEETVENQEPNEIEYNIMDIDFHKLISKEGDEEIIELHKYFRGVQPTAKNDYTGKYEGYNLILITAEGFSPYAVHKEVTPTLYKMIHEGYNFTNFYTPIWEVSTSDGEYVANTGLIPKSGVWSLPESGANFMPFTMGNQLKKLAYKTVAYHNHTYDYYDRDISHPNMGYDYKGVGNGLKITKVWPASDLEMMENTISEYISQQPFHAYYMTVSGHLRYTFVGNSMASKNRDIVKDLPYSENARAYIASQVELDRALEHLLNELEEEKIADKTLIAVSSDHYPYGLEDEEIDELAGYDVEKNFELYRNHFILYTKDMEAKVIDKPSSSLDIMPTISNLLGLEYDSRLLMGRDIFSDSEPLVIFLNRSFIADKGKYYAQNREFIPNEGEEISDNYIEHMMNLVNSKFYYSAKILETDYYNSIFNSE